MRVFALVILDCSFCCGVIMLADVQFYNDNDVILFAFPFLMQISIIVTKLHEQLEVKGRELSEFKEKYGIRFQGEEERDKDSKPSPDSKAQGVLVS